VEVVNESAEVVNESVEVVNVDHVTNSSIGS
jgi:hypothetical protein